MLLKLLTLTLLHTQAYASVHTRSSSLDSAPIIDLGYAIYEGTFNQTRNATSFLGIRFAAPPVGKLRFQAPAQPLNERALGVQRTDVIPKGCLQSSFGLNPSSPFRHDPSNGTDSLQRRQDDFSEDCLFLNVWVPGTLDPKAGLPVLVWIHGGGYVLGDVRLTPGDDLIREASGGLVVVTFDYRLGVFGFLAGTQVKRKGALNAGLLDQQAVLQWVQKNIHHFGGNPDEVTIWGESAGAGSVVQHLVANGGNTQPPLFKAAITSSTYMYLQYKYNDKIPEQVYSELVKRTSCSNATDTFDCLVDLDVSILEQASVDISTSVFFGTFATLPVIDGEFTRTSPTLQIDNGRLNGHCFLAITNTHEGINFINRTMAANMSLPEFVSALFPHFDNEQINAVSTQYSNISSLETSVDEQAAIMAVASAREVRCVLHTFSLVLQHFTGTAYKGEFAVPPGMHGDDIPYYFPQGLGTPPPFPNPVFIASFAGAFLSFAKFGNPSAHPVQGSITPQWKPFKDNNTEMLFNRTEGSQPDIRAINTDEALLERCALWKSLSSAIGQ